MREFSRAYYKELKRKEKKKKKKNPNSEQIKKLATAQEKLFISLR